MKNIYEKAIKFYGKISQIIVAIEELGELIQALAKHLRGFDNAENIAEEIADVEIMLKQLKIIYNNESIVDEYKEVKLKQLKGEFQNELRM